MSQANENKINPITIGLQGIGMVVLILLSYLGLNYIWAGSGVLPLIVSLLGAILIFGMVFGLNKMKNLPDNQGVRTGEIALWVAYGLLAIASFFPVAHFVNVDVSAKEAIQEDGLTRLAELETMSEEYRGTVDRKVEEIKVAIEKIASDVRAGGDPATAAAAAKKYGISDPGKRKKESLAVYYEEEAASKAANYYAAATEDPDGDNLYKRENENLEFAAFHNSVLNNWNRGELYKSLNAIEEKVQDFKVYLSDLYIDRNDNESAWDENEFTYEDKAESIENVINSPQAVKAKYADQTGILLPLGLLLLVHLFILSPYLFLNRLGKRRYYNKPDPVDTGQSGGIEI